MSSFFFFFLREYEKFKMKRSVKQKKNRKRKTWILVIALIVRLIVGIYDIVSVILIMFQ
jgi:flagellar basal body-associated protein FliL